MTERLRILNRIKTFESIVAMKVCTKAAGILKHLSTVLQYKNVDFLMAQNEIQTVIILLKSEIDDQCKFSELYDEAKIIADQIGIQEAFPKRYKRRNESKLENHIFVHYKENMYFAYLKKIVSELDMRFSGKQVVAFRLQFFLPCHIKNLT